MKPRIVSAILPFCIAALAAEVLLPWCLVWLSDRFLFDIPDWSLWLVFAGPPVAGLLLLLWRYSFVRFVKRLGAGRCRTQSGQPLAGSA